MQEAPVGHLLPHRPQFSSSLFRSTHLSPQVLSPFGQTQDPSIQDFQSGHLLPHWPQFSLSLFKFTHILASPLLQGEKPSGQRHSPSLQKPKIHLLPHCPQFSSSLFRSTHLSPQALKPFGQIQAPLMQYFPSGQLLLHLPQWARSVFKSAHFPAQFAKPAGQRTLSEKPCSLSSPPSSSTPSFPPKFFPTSN